MKDEKLIIQPKKYRDVTSVVSARLPGDMVRRLDEIASETGYNRNELIAICLEFAIDRMEYQKSRKKTDIGKGGRS
ncbi:MAG: ribbon-helix-helix protein, CopG family [Lachnospiraceae bacterium]|nr:ribbon-helix-helix protein, CopG family [Lachnospiraceae bacterium]